MIQKKRDHHRPLQTKLETVREWKSSMDNEELGKPPPPDPSMEDGAFTAPMPTPTVVGQVVAAAEPPPHPREWAVGAELPQRPRERAVSTEKQPRPRVQVGAATAASNTDNVDPFFLAMAGEDISCAPNRGV